MYTRDIEPLPSLKDEDALLCLSLLPSTVECDEMA